MECDFAAKEEAEGQLGAEDKEGGSYRPIELTTKPILSNSSGQMSGQLVKPNCARGTGYQLARSLACLGQHSRKRDSTCPIACRYSNSDHPDPSRRKVHQSWVAQSLPWPFLDPCDAGVRPSRIESKSRDLCR